MALAFFNLNGHLVYNALLFAALYVAAQFNTFRLNESLRCQETPLVSCLRSPALVKAMALYWVVS